MKVVVVTPGDPDGIGPEVVWKTLQTRKHLKQGVLPICIGARRPFEKLGAPVHEVTEEDLSAPDRLHSLARRKFNGIYLLPAPTRCPEKERFLSGYQAGWSIVQAVRWIQMGRADALVTGPINKERLQKGGFAYAGHTDLLADLCGVEDVTMMLANDLLRVSLVTTHVGLKKIPEILTRAKIRRAVRDTVRDLTQWWGIKKPRVAIAALNPHAGESGLFGREEIETIAPEIRALRRAAKGRYLLTDPLPSDTLFANHILKIQAGDPRGLYDAVVCMYHDQGLIPVKLLDFRKTVNVTLGLPIVRTSVDHGTAFDIAGKDKADPSSFASALDLAMMIVKNRNQRSTTRVKKK